MKIIFDARFTSTSYFDGISRYTSNLCFYLNKILLNKRITLMMLISDKKQLKLLPCNIEYKKLNSPKKITEFFIARKINKLNPDIVICPIHTTGFIGKKYKLILTVHDLIYFIYKEVPKSLPLYLKYIWKIYHTNFYFQKFILSKADAIVTVSHTTKNLILHYGLTQKPVSIISNASNLRLNKNKKILNLKKRLIYVGSFMLYKNVETLIKSMAYLKGYSLELISRIDPKRKVELKNLINKKYHNNIIFHNGLEEKKYLNLLKNSRALVNLSFVEGYGLPLIEAMSLGVPIIASNIRIFHEIGGNSIQYIIPSSVSEFINAVHKLEDKKLWRYYSNISLTRSKSYNWKKSANNLFRLITKIK